MIKIIRKEEFQLPAKEILTGISEVQKSVAEIIFNVIKNRDQSLRDYTEKFDHVKLQNIRVPQDVIQESGEKLKPEDRQVLEAAIANIRYFHQKQLGKSWKETHDDGTQLGQIVTPIDRVGIYIPGGRAVYPSSLMMNAIPAQIAGVPSIAVVSPPQKKTGLPHEMVLGTCALLSLNEVYAVGGAQSIAALAYGTESISPVFKITGPGNEYVAEAKRQVFGKVGIDSIAGPSEILILHDDPDVPTEYIVRDMLSQTEHDPEARATLITTSEETANKVAERLKELVPQLPRSEIITESLKKKGMIIIVENIEDGIDIANQIAPEHLEVFVKDESLISQIRNAGAIFVGKWSSEPVGDYFAGPNHILPTNGTAKYSSPLRVQDFQKCSSFIRYSEARIKKEGRMIAYFAEMEELYAHAEAVKVRLEKS